MQAWKTVGVGLVLAGVLAGCGQKGPLYREAPDNIARDAVQESRSDDTNREQDAGASTR
jgi:predicted small lipoprotein YifL